MTELPLTVSDLEGAPDDGNRYEVIEGDLHISAPPSYSHQRVLCNLAFAVGTHLEQYRTGTVVPGVSVIFDQFNGVIPDLLYLSQERKKLILKGGRLTAA